MTTAPVIRTDRLRLRGHVMADFEPLYALFASDRARYMDGPIPARDTWFWVAAEVGSWPLQGIGSWGIERQSDGAFLGQVGINKPQHFPEREIGWVLLQAFEGHGYAREAAEAALGWARTQRFDTLVSYIDRENARSVALARRLGATEDPSAPLPDGDTPEDTVVYRHALAGAA